MSDVTETTGPSSLVIVTEAARAATIVQPEADTVTETVGPASIVVVGEAVEATVLALGMQGPVGARGAAGADGADGAAGAAGAAGTDGSPGAAGAAGATGPQGPQGPEGGTTATYYQSVPAASATIVHNLNKFPVVTTVTLSGDIVVGDVDYVDANTVIVSFSSPFSWVAYLE